MTPSLLRSSARAAFMRGGFPKAARLWAVLVVMETM